MKHLVLVPAVAISLCCSVQGQLVTFAPGSTLKISGNVFTDTTAFSFNCTDPDSDGPYSPVPNPQQTPLGTTGAPANWIKFLSADSTCPMAHAETSYDVVIAGTATNSSLHASYIGIGNIEGNASDAGPPCPGPMPEPSATFFARINSGTNQIRIPFTVTETCFMVINAQIFYLGEADGSASATWNSGVICTSIVSPSGTVNASSAQPIDMDAFMCCVFPDDYEMIVDISVNHFAGGEAHCQDLFVEDGDQVNVGFTFNMNFQDYCSCPGDLNNDGVVSTPDLLIVIGGWGTCPTPPAACPGDANHDGIVDVNDLNLVIGAWGACPCCLE